MPPKRACIASQSLQEWPQWGPTNWINAPAGLRSNKHRAFWGFGCLVAMESLLKDRGWLKRSTSYSVGSFIWHLLPSNRCVKHELKFHIIDMLKNIRQLAGRMDNLQALLSLCSVVQVTECIYFYNLGMTKWCVNFLNSKFCQIYLSIIAFQKALQSMQGPILILVKEGLGTIAGIHSQWSQIEDQRLVRVLTSKGKRNKKKHGNSKTIMVENFGCLKYQ